MTTPSTMYAIAFGEYGGPDRLYLTEIPQPVPGPGEVRIRVVAAAVNPADVKWRAGMFREIVPLTLPHILGYDVAGTIDQVGENAGDFVAGDRVAAMLNPVTKGGYAQFAVAHTGAVARIPDSLDDVVAAAIPTAGLTGFQLIERDIRPVSGETVLVTGATGAVGRFAVYAAQAAGARVIAAVRGRHRDEALRLGADDVIVLDDEGAAVPAFDHVADTVGGPSIARLCRHLRPGARIRTAATTPISGEGLVDTPQFITVQPDGALLSRIFGLIADGAIAVPIDRVLPLDQASEAHRILEAGGLSGKLILQP